MNKNDYVVNIMRTALLFDNILKNKQYCDLRKTNDLLKTHLQNLILISNTIEYDKIIELCKTIYYTNLKIIEITENKIYNKIHNNINIHKILILFYVDNCNESQKFIMHWKALELYGKYTENNVKMVSINCNNKKYEHICKTLNIYEYPTIKYIENNKIYNYFSPLTAQDIRKEFKL